MPVGHCLRDRGPGLKISERSLKEIEKDYHMARGCALSPHFLLSQLKNRKKL